jgi:hypothetical protein
MKCNPCVACGERAERLIATCCGGVICQTCLEQLEAKQGQSLKCVWCRGDMTLTGFIDLPNAYRVFKKVNNVLID